MPPGRYEAGLLAAAVLLVIPLRNDLLNIPGAMIGAGSAAALDGKGQGRGLRSSARESKVVFTGQGGSYVDADRPQRAPTPTARAAASVPPQASQTAGASASPGGASPSGGGGGHPPAFQLCTAKAPADRWQVFELWPTHKLHVLEAEVIRPSDKYAAGGNDVLSILAVISDETDTKNFGVRLSHWNPLVMSQMWNAEVAELRCTWRQNSNDGHGGSSSKMAAEPTQVRAVWFQEKGHMLGMYLQCLIPKGSGLALKAAGFEFGLERVVAPTATAAMRMCPNKYRPKQYNVALCTTSQFPNGRIGRREVAEWLEYHRLAGVDHVFFRDRTMTGYGTKIKVDGPHNQTLKSYVEEGFVTYIPGPYHPPFDWGSVYSDQLYTNVACYMRLRHAATWIGTVDLDEAIEIQQQQPDGTVTPQYLPEYLAALPATVQEVALMHCRLMTIPNRVPGGPPVPAKHEKIDGVDTWEPHGRNNKNDNRLILPSGTMRNCRFDIPAGKSLGRVADTSFSHVHFLYPSEHPALSQHPHCAWRWYNGTTPTSCVISGNYPAHDAKVKPFLDYGSYTHLAGVNHGGGKWLNFRGYRDNATDAFLNTTLNDRLNARLDQLAKASGA